MIPEGLPPHAPSFYEENSVCFHEKDRESYRRIAAREGTWDWFTIQDNISFLTGSL